MHATLFKTLVIWVSILMVSGCAGSAPDFSQRTTAVQAKQTELVQWLEADRSVQQTGLIKAPVCSSSVGHPPTGWGIEDGNWCVISCPTTPAGSNEQRWFKTHDGLRCIVAKPGSGDFIETEYKPEHWRLDQQPLLKGFDRAFISDTKWKCVEQEYQIDPQSLRGFWLDIGEGTIYRFYRDGALMIGQSDSSLKYAGQWNGSHDSGVVINDRESFLFAVNYGAGRFDEYRSSTRKQVCRFFDNAGARS